MEWMYTLYKFHFFYGISEINQLFDDILIICTYIYIYIYIYIYTYTLNTVAFYCGQSKAHLWNNQAV